MANLSKVKGQEPFPQWAFIGFNLHRNTGCIHKAQSLLGSNDQPLDNIQRTMGLFRLRVRQLKGYKTLGVKLIFYLDLYRVN